MIILLLGAPGAGKGTQAAKLADYYGYFHLSTGDMFRDAIANETKLGKEVKAILDRGDLVPDALTVSLVEDRISQPDCTKGIVLDGFPRTVAQAKALDVMLESNNKSLDQIIELDVDQDALVKRKAGRLYAPKSKCVYHKEFNPPKVAGKCDESGEDLIQREDDKPEATRHRLKIYFEQTAPVLAFYGDRIKKIDGMKSMDDVFSDLIQKMS